MAPDRPAVPFSAAEQFQVRSPAARFDQFVLLIGLSRMLPFPAGQKVDLSPSGRQRPRTLAADAEQDEFRDVAEIEAYAAPVRTAVLADLVPDDVGLVLETPQLSIHQGRGAGAHWEPTDSNALRRANAPLSAGLRFPARKTRCRNGSTCGVRARPYPFGYRNAMVDRPARYRTFVPRFRTRNQPQPWIS